MGIIDVLAAEDVHFAQLTSQGPSVPNAEDMKKKKKAAPPQQSPAEKKNFLNKKSILIRAMRNKMPGRGID
ncbi:hypothetical protein QS257_10030 [Terrilactibacillus sp. S3-3]|nr:hypothetical protein QS257_10030 [Terrilactibacillus sp. S3-3]